MNAAASRPEPRIDDLLPGTTLFRYANYEEYFNDARKWEREEILREVKKSHGSSGAGFGIGLGSAIATILSFELNHSIWYMILHGTCSWLYVIYRAWQGNY